MGQEGAITHSVSGLVPVMCEVLMLKINDIGPEYDFEDVDCADCGMKFYVRPSAYRPYTTRDCPIRCPRCVKGLPPLYEY